MIPVFYRPEQSCEESTTISPSAGKPALVVNDWLANSEIAPHIQVQHFSPATDEVLYAAHDRIYIDGVLACEIENGFGSKSRAVADTLRYTVGSIVAAAKNVLTREADFRVAVSPTSGFHHAGYDFSGGFCTFNGLMAAAIWMRTLGLAKRILILDLDAHYGNGTDDIISHLGIDYVTNITATKGYRTAMEAMKQSHLYRRMRDKGETIYDLVLYQAGADIHVDDPLGGLLTTEQMAERDRIVFKGCTALHVPVVWNLAGGYQRDKQGTIEPVLALHRQTMMACIKQATQ